MKHAPAGFITSHPYETPIVVLNRLPVIFLCHLKALNLFKTAGSRVLLAEHFLAGAGLKSR